MDYRSLNFSILLAFIQVELEKLCDIKIQLKNSNDYLPELIASVEKVSSIEGTAIEEAAEDLLSKMISAKVIKILEKNKKVLQSIIHDLPIHRSKLKDCQVTENLQLRVTDFK